MGAACHPSQAQERELDSPCFHHSKGTTVCLPDDSEVSRPWPGIRPQVSPGKCPLCEHSLASAQPTRKLSGPSAAHEAQGPLGLAGASDINEGCSQHNSALLPGHQPTRRRERSCWQMSFPPGLGQSKAAHWMGGAGKILLLFFPLSPPFLCLPSPSSLPFLVPLHFLFLSPPLMHTSYSLSLSLFLLSHCPPPPLSGAYLLSFIFLIFV